MKRFPLPSPLRLACATVLLVSAGLAQAQYAWINANGSREYSDRPPPPSVPRSKILKVPHGSPLAQEADAPAPAADAKAEKKNGPPTLAEREADFRKRKQEQAEQEKKAAQEAQHKEAQAENCASARQYKAQLESGIRVADTAPDGERAFISDEERAKRLAKTKRVLETCR
jgi:cell pole-organizing protein PopZ